MIFDEDVTSPPRHIMDSSYNNDAVNIVSFENTPKSFLESKVVRLDLKLPMSLLKVFMLELKMMPFIQVPKSTS